MKAVTWRVAGTTATVVIAWWVTGDLSVGVEVGAVDFFAKMFLYYLHERFWYKFVHWGVSTGEAD